MSGIVVSSDDSELLSVAEKYKSEGVQTRKREDFYASDTVTHSEYFEHIAEAEVGDADEVLYCPVTVIQWLHAISMQLLMTFVFSWNPPGAICFCSRL